MKFNPLVAKTTGTGGGQNQPKFGWKPDIPVTITNVRINNGTFEDKESNTTTPKGSFVLTGMQDGDEKERWYYYSSGKAGSKDGINFDYPPHENSEFAHFAAALVGAGFNPETLKVVAPDGVEEYSLQNLVGQRFTFEMIKVLGQDGKPKTKNGYPVWTAWPVKYVGRTGGDEPAPDETNPLRDKTVSVVAKLLSDNGGFLSRVDLIKKLTQATAGDPDAHKILALVTKESFHSDVPWTRDTAGYKLIA